MLLEMPEAPGVFKHQSPLSNTFIFIFFIHPKFAWESPKILTNINSRAIRKFLASPDYIKTLTMARPNGNIIPWSKIHQKNIHPALPLLRTLDQPSSASPTAKEPPQQSQVPKPILYSTIHNKVNRPRPTTGRIKLPEINQFPSSIAKEAWQAYTEENDPDCLERSIALDPEGEAALAVWKWFFEKLE